MAAHRYWRAVALESYSGADLEITEFQLFSGTTRVDAAATLTSSAAPTTGSLANLKDDDADTGASWSSVLGLALVWDFGSGGDVDVTNIRLGAASALAKFLLIAKLQWSDDATAWTDGPTFAGIAWPGAWAMTTTLALPAVTWSTTDKGAGVSLTNGDMTATATLADSVRATQGKSFGVWQFEVTIGAGAGQWMVGIGTASATLDLYPGADQNGQGYWNADGNKYNNGTPSSYGASYTTGDVIGAVVNFAANTVTFYKNGVSQGPITIVTGSGGPRFPMFGSGSTSATPCAVTLNETMVYPVAGASPWIVGSSHRIALNTVQGRAVSMGAIAVSSGDSVAKPYGQTRNAFAVKGRKDFASGVLGLGIGRIAATVEVDATPNDLPVVRRVRLYRMRDGALVREVWSNADGTFSFDYIDELERYYVIAFDYTHSYRAVIADNLTPSLIA
jgi:hypothetical protein